MTNEIPTTTDANGIQYIQIHKLHPHPANPRKDVGDVTELAESIKANGILQNLTVVPYYSPVHKRIMSGLYTVIIGHRRLAAAKVAGLEELPCVVVEMTDKEQISTMLTENMQRVDLSIYEQAQGFQMMLDMGDSMAEIADKSGFSKTTVRKRLEIAKLDSKAVKKATDERQVTMADFDKLAEVEDIEARNRLLATIGTPNFKNALNAELQNQKTKKRIAEWLGVVETFASEIAADKIDRDVMTYVCNYSWYNLNSDVKVPEDADTVKYFYKLTEKEIDIYKERDKGKEMAEQEAREERWRLQHEEEERWNEINNRHFDLRMDFVKQLSGAACKKAMGEIMVFFATVMQTVAGGGYYSPKLDKGTFGYCMGVKVEVPDNNEVKLTDIPDVRNAINVFPEKAALCLAYSTIDNKGRGYWEKYWDSDSQKYKYRHKENHLLDAVYAVLDALGYEMSDEEKQMQDGSNEVFNEKEAENG